MKKIGHIFALIWIVIPSLLHAQEQVPFDHDGEFYIMDRTLRDQLGLFQEYTDFLEATMYEVDRETFELNILTETDGRRQRHQKIYTQSEYDALRDRVSRELARREPELDQSGRVRFLIGTTSLSTGFYGWAIPTGLDIGGTSGVALYLIISAGGYFVPSALISNRTMTRADARVSIYGGSIGILHGLALGNLISPDSYRSQLLFGVSGSLGSLMYGYSHSRSYEFTEGQAEMFATSGNYGTLMGIGMGTIVYHQSESENAALATYLMTAAAGHAGSHYLAMSTNATIGNSRLMRTSYILGGMAPLGILSLADVDDLSVIMATIMAGGTAGLIYSYRLSRDYALSEQQGLTVELVTTASYLLGFGIGLLVSDEDPTVTLLSGAVGGVTGYTISLRRALVQHTTATGSRSSGYQFDFGLEPVRNRFAGASNSTSIGEAIVPVLRLHGSF